MICPRCNKGQAIEDPGLGILPCETCQASDDEMDKIESPEFYSLDKIHRIQRQLDMHGKDILQPYANGKDWKPNPDFVKAYPDKAKDYFSDDQLKKI